MINSNITCTKAKISNWENWDKESHSAGNEYWEAFGSDNKPQNIIL